MNQDKKPRFILIDPSAIHTGGHHYEYAMRILNLAKERGFNAELWAHKNADLPRADFTVRPVFQNSFYENFRGPKGLPSLKSMEGGSLVSRKLKGLYNRALERSLPFFMETSLGLHAARAIHDAGQHVFKPVYNSPQNKVKTPVLLYFFFYGLYILGRKAKELCFNDRVKKVLKFAGAIAFLLLLPLWLMVGIALSAYILMRLSARKPYQIFASDLAKALRQIGTCNENDIIFIPTCFSTEIRAMGEFLNKNGGDNLPQMHLLFRTNVFAGHTNTHRDQLSRQLDYRQSFKWIQQNYPNAPIHYYTDTSQLSAQYKILSDCDFTVLPIPVPWTMPEHKGASQNTINIAYVGDVRDEKGYQHYPHIIEALQENYISTGKIRFTLQSNFADNMDVSRDSAIAQSLLKSFSPDIIEHIQGPLDSLRYKALIENADIVLITYKPENYMARSSGIFIEALKAGKAILMPSFTWMASEIEPERQARWSKSIESLLPVRKFSTGEWQVGQRYEIPDTSTKWIVAEFQFCTTTEETMFVELAVEPLNALTRTFSPNHAVRVAQVNSDGKCLVMLKLPEAKNDYALHYKTYGGEGGLLSSKIYAGKTPWQGPQDFAASIYPHDNPIQMVPALRELIENIDAYKADALRFASARGNEYTAETLLSRLLEQAGYVHDIYKSEAA